MMKYLQKLGKSLMLPVACLPVAAILMGIGYWIDPTGWGANNIAAAFLIKAGSALVDNMAILFAIGVALSSCCAGLSYITQRFYCNPPSKKRKTKKKDCDEKSSLLADEDDYRYANIACGLAIVFGIASIGFFIYGSWTAYLSFLVSCVS